MVGRTLLAFLIAAHAALSQTVLLQIRPHIGDTLRMHLSQTVEVTGTNRDRGRDSTSSLTTSVEVYTRAIAQQWTSSGTLMQTITDSVQVKPTTDASVNDLRRRALESKQVFLRVSPDGAMEVVSDSDPTSELRDIFGGMPAMLARQPVKVGEKWSREMQIPLSGDPGAMGSVKATFRLDSLGKNGDIAYVSMRGTMSRVNPVPPTPVTGYTTSGTLTGTIQIDRRLGWITDSRSSIIVRSTIAPVAGRKGEPQRSPMEVRTKITQWIRAMRAR